MRQGTAASYEFLINNASQPEEITLASGGRELLSDIDVTGRLELPPQGVAIVRRQARSPRR